MILSKLKTAWALGITNVVRVFWFRIGVSLGLNPVKRLQSKPQQGPFFSERPFFLNRAVSSHYSPLGFGYLPLDSQTQPPKWHQNILTGEFCQVAGQPWYKIPDFTKGLGDIKGVWEYSRFDWVLGFAREYREGNANALKNLEDWLADWAKVNAPYLGPNWKCGQEASIRVMHLAMATVVLDQVQHTRESLLDLVKAHLERIAPTIQYAIAQDNNHGTSEAAALFIGGSWLELHGLDRGKKWRQQGRKWLENRARRLIEPDGSFSQYSLNYHRVMLDTFSMVEVWRRKLLLPKFSSHWYGKAATATGWLDAMLQPSGDVPNIGANDGARLFPLAMTDYRDFRPSVQLASALFRDCRAVREPGEWDAPLELLGIAAPAPTSRTLAPDRGCQLFNNGGYAILRDERCFALLRYPRFRFRPGQADALHLDFWIGEHNIFRDGGSYSYNTEEPWQSYFPGVQAHNTVQFDGRDQMPRLGRFLFGEWLSTRSFQPIKKTPEGYSVQAGYRDYQGARHTRRVILGKDYLRVEDDVSVFTRSAVLRWRLEPGEWKLDNQSVSKGDLAITVTADVSIIRREIVEGWESLYYGQKTPLPVLEIEVADPGRLTTEITWNTF